MLLEENNFEECFGIVGGTFAMLITLEQRFEIKLFDENTDKSDRMVGGNIVVDFFSTRRMYNQASETREDFCLGSCGRQGLAVPCERSGLGGEGKLVC